jgi:hypothetical protein
VTCDPNCDAPPPRTNPKAASTAHLTAEPLPSPTNAAIPADAAAADGNVDRPQAARPREIGGREGLDPTRYGDWELRGRCIDF